MKCCKVMSPPAHLISIYRYFQSRRGRKIGADMSHKFSKHIMVAMCKAYPALYLAENEYGEWNLILMCPTKSLAPLEPVLKQMSAYVQPGASN